MKIGITGTSKLAKFLIEDMPSEEWYTYRLVLASLSWEPGPPVTDCDIFINHAHVGWEQIELLDRLYHAWKDDDTKMIINISSRAKYPNISMGYKYAAQKSALNHYSDNLVYNSPKKFRVCTLNLGLMENSEISSLTYRDISDTIKYVIANDHLEFSEITLSHRENYQSVQKKKLKMRYQNDN